MEESIPLHEGLTLHKDYEGQESQQQQVLKRIKNK